MESRCQKTPRTRGTPTNRRWYCSESRVKKASFLHGLKKPECELCGWAQKSIDGRIPIELDHINGDHSDNRLENLRILCPNCHSLQPTHRGRNKKVRFVKVRTHE